jgi:predicted DNA-binding ribbon-helix-helix protein
VDKLRNITIDGRPTSLRLEAEYWSALDEIGALERFPVPVLCSFISRRYPQGSLASGVRVFVTRYYGELARNGVQAGDAPRPAGA